MYVYIFSLIIKLKEQQNSIVSSSHAEFRLCMEVSTFLSDRKTNQGLLAHDGHDSIRVRNTESEGDEL